MNIKNDKNNKKNRNNKNISSVFTWREDLLAIKDGGHFPEVERT